MFSFVFKLRNNCFGEFNSIGDSCSVDIGVGGNAGDEGSSLIAELASLWRSDVGEGVGVVIICCGIGSTHKSLSLDIGVMVGGVMNCGGDGGVMNCDVDVNVGAGSVQRSLWSRRGIEC